MQPKTNDAARVGRRRLLLIVAIFVAPIALALGWYLLAPRLAPGGFAHGTLIDPARPLEPFEIEGAAGGRYTLDDLRGQWSIIHAVGESCGDACRERLHATRQIHDALGEDRIRVQRVALAADGRRTHGLAAILGEHRRLTVLPVSAGSALARQIPDAPDGTVFLVDPLGNLMMRFGPGVAPGEILDDLERLLKLSRIG